MHVGDVGGWHLKCVPRWWQSERISHRMGCRALLSLEVHCASCTRPRISIWYTQTQQIDIENHTSIFIDTRNIIYTDNNGFTKLALCQWGKQNKRGKHQSSTAAVPQHRGSIPIGILGCGCNPHLHAYFSIAFVFTHNIPCSFHLCKYFCSYSVFVSAPAAFILENSTRMVYTSQQVPTIGFWWR